MSYTIKVNLTRQMYKEVKAAATKQGVTMTQFTSDALTAALVEFFKGEKRHLARREQPRMTQTINQKYSHRRTAPPLPEDEWRGENL